MFEPNSYVSVDAPKGTDGSHVGDIFQVLATDGPFVSCRQLFCRYGGNAKTRLYVFHTGRTPLRPLSEDFVKITLEAAE